MTQEEFNEKLTYFLEKSPKVSILNASPYAFEKMISMTDDETLENIKNTYDFYMKYAKKDTDPFIFMNYTLLKDRITTEKTFDIIMVAGDKTLFCKN